MLAVVDAYGPVGIGFEVSTEFTIEVCGRSGTLWQYSSGPACSALDPGVGDLARWFDFWARDRFADLLTDVRRDGFDGPDPPADYGIAWDITDAARETQRRCDATPVDQRPAIPEPIRIPVPESGVLWNEPMVSWRRKPSPGTD
ncbi:hypothetical protein OM076_00855 [Solirubrobacter ginsenosidimutans]|uniref:Uncharacterized protein n=1 Tax=Solirubrobacter ginsenosidimutans TaxID=490573 RepID=A0A9X3MN57_9ACTN|nr:hypothetical protein [Solirubrobacter ginsenosidimutans]MDA0158797.1 hypothetical protein [Solirubrobacter ginsenosidimutans]